MSSGRSQRSLSNVKLTKKHHFRYLGLWMLVTSCLVVALNLLLYVFVEEHWAGIDSLSSQLHEEYMNLRGVFRLVMLIEVFLFIVALVALGKLTAHRIAGPYVRLQITFDAVAKGDFQTRLKFRDYDRLEEVEDSFNAMMDTLEKKAGGSPGNGVDRSA